MKKFKFVLLAFMATMIATFAFTSCEDENDEPKDVSVTGISLSSSSLSLQEGNTETLTATVTPENATNTSVTWSTSDEQVATVAEGVVTAVAEGTAIITAKTNDGGFEATCTVTVTKEIPPFDESKYHFDLFLTVGKHGGMSSKNTTVVNSVETLTADRGTINIVGEGTELNDYSMECISKGKYYYQVPSSSDRFVKYQIKNNQVSVVAERPFKTNTYKVRAYAHTWLDDNTLIIMASNGSAHVYWTKLNTDDMSIIAEGELGLALPEGYDKFTTAGILSYRQADNKLFYFYYGKTDSSSPMGATNEPKFRTAVINASTMAVEQEGILAPIESEMAGSAYGELLQNFVTYDDAGNLYLAAFYEDENKYRTGYLMRINAGETSFDPSYNAYNVAGSKILTVQYIGNNKALLYVSDDDNGNGTSIQSVSYYYVIVDLTTGAKERLSYDGKVIGLSSGSFSQRSVVFNGKAYIGVNTADDENAVIYIYDVKTGTIEKGAEVAGGFYFDMIRVIEND